MKKRILMILAGLFLLQTAFAQESKEARDQRMQWWREARFGMFIHWGFMPSLPAFTRGTRCGAAAANGS